MERDREEMEQVEGVFERRRRRSRRRRRKRKKNWLQE